MSDSGMSADFEVENAIGQLNDAFDALRMAGKMLRDADAALHAENERATQAEAKLAAVEAVIAESERITLTVSSNRALRAALSGGHA